MKTELFCVYDSAAGRFLDPFPAPTVEFAIRQFRQVVNTPDHQFNQFPDDYTLFHVATFDWEKGTVGAREAPTSLGVAITFIERNAPLKLEAEA